MYKKASRLKLRFETKKGILNVEQLWTLSLSDLDELAVSLEEELNKSKTKSFLECRSNEDKIISLKFDIVFDILTTKLEEQESNKKELETKEHNEKIMRLISKKQEDELQNKSIDDLVKLLK